MNVQTAKGIITGTLRKLIREQNGQALPLALAMLAIGSLVTVPLLSLTGTTLRSGMREEGRIYEHYAANAGIMDGIREIVAVNPSLPAMGNNWTYAISSTNNRTVNVTVYRIDQYNWKITSTAITGNGGSTELDCYVEQKRYLQNAITAASVAIEPAAGINGNVQYDSTLGSLINSGVILGEIIDRPIEWPAVEEVSAFYLDRVGGAPTIEGDLSLNLGTETLTNPYSLGPIYIHGNLTASAPSQGAMRLDGPVYVTGNVIINNGVRIYQNNKNLYADGAIGIRLMVGSAAYGDGAIVARNGIDYFSSTISSSYSIVWSLQGWLSCNPNGQFNGMLYSGELNTQGKVTVGNGRVVNYAEPSSDLPLPLLPPGAFRIIGWESRAQ